MYSNASFTFVVIVAATAAAANTDDAYFLFNFKASVKEDPTGAFKSWQLNSAARPCDWEGVQCDVSVLKGVPVVRGLSLSNRDILGTLWNDMGKLRFMRTFNLTGNRFQGRLMSYVGDALVLETLDLSNNDFTGVLPAFNKLVYLKSLVLYGNQFEGDFPGTACDAGAIRYIDLSNNNLRECGPGAQTNEQADVYSYGLTILELITRKRSTTGMLLLNKSLQARMRNLFPHNVVQLVDTDIIRTTTDSNQVLALIEIALSCAEDDPAQRPDMRSVVSMLTKVKNGDVEDYSQRSEEKRIVTYPQKNSTNFIYQMLMLSL